MRYGLTMKTKLQAAVEMGRLGGKAGRGKCKARTSEQARKAAMVRVEKARAAKACSGGNS